MNENLRLVEKAREIAHCCCAAMPYTGMEYEVAKEAALMALKSCEVPAEISQLEKALKTIAGSHWQRFGIDQTDIEHVPDLSAEEAMNLARDALQAWEASQ